MDPIKVGIIGFGRSGCGIHADAIAQQQEKFTVVAICDERPDRRSHEAFPQAKPYAEAAAKYDPAKLTDGWNTVGDERIFYVSNPALGLWKKKEN